MEEDNSNIEIRTCANEWCTNEFEINTNNKSSSKKRFCSRGCSNRSKKTQQKIKQTNLKKYGTEYPLLNKEIRDKADQTNLKNYGHKNVSKSKDIKAKKKETSFQRYGVEHPMISEQVRDKLKETNVEKYGVDNAMKSEDVKNRMMRTKFKKHFNTVLTSDAFSEKVGLLFGVDEYSGIYDSYPFICKRCDNEFEDILTKGRIPRCPKCYPHINTSFMEKDLLYYLESLGLCVETNVRNIIPPLELDLYLPDKNLAIELNGNYWHSQNFGGKDKKYHLQKTLECEEQNIQLIHIFEDEWLSHQNIVRSRFKHILNLSDGRRIYGRKCVVKEVSPQKKNMFLNKHHIQGEDRSKIKIGLYYEDELVSIMTFSKPRISLGAKNKRGGVWELTRYCSSEIVVGGASKLFSHFVKTKNPEEVYTYADRRWSHKSEDIVYEKMGFDFVKETEPNYFYIAKNGGKRYHRFSFRKSELKNKLSVFDDDLTEWENMQLNEYDRIWDCGHLKYEWKN